MPSDKTSKLWYKMSKVYHSYTHSLEEYEREINTEGDCVSSATTTKTAAAGSK